MKCILRADSNILLWTNFAAALDFCEPIKLGHVHTCPVLTSGACLLLGPCLKSQAKKKKPKAAETIFRIACFK